MPILVKRNNISREVCWECGLRFMEDESVILWDALRPVLLHSRCALEVGQRILGDANQALEMDNLN